VFLHQIRPKMLVKENKCECFVAQGVSLMFGWLWHSGNVTHNLLKAKHIPLKPWSHIVAQKSDDLSHNLHS